MNNSSLYLKECQIDNQEINFSLFLIANFSELVIENIIFSHNIFIENSWISAFLGNLTLTNITFDDNIINCDLNSFISINEEFDNCFKENVLIISKLNVSNNYISTSFLNSNGMKSVIMNDSLFQNNSALMMISISNSQNISIFNTSFQNNKIIWSDNIQNSGGNLQFLSTNYISLNLFFIYACYSEVNKVVGLFVLNVNSLILMNCTFAKNIGNYTKNIENSNNNLGVVLYFYMESSESVLLIQHSFFSQNQLLSKEQSFEGAPCALIILPKGRLEIYETIFENNLSEDFSTCLNLIGQTIVISNVKFIQNGGISIDVLQKNTFSGVLVIDFYNLTILQSNFILNEANLGTCIILKRKSAFEFQILFAETVNFIGNYAYDSSNVLHVFSDEMQRLFIFKKCNFIQGKSDGLSGLFFFGTKSSSIFQNYSFYECVFLQNSCNNFGALMEHYPPNPNNCLIYFESSQFLDNFLTNKDANVQGILFDVWGEALGSTEDKIYAIHVKNCFFSGKIKLLNIF